MLPMTLILNEIVMTIAIIITYLWWTCSICKYYSLIGVCELRVNCFRNYRQIKIIYEYSLEVSSQYFNEKLKYLLIYFSYFHIFTYLLIMYSI